VVYVCSLCASFCTGETSFAKNALLLCINNCTTYLCRLCWGGTVARSRKAVNSFFYCLLLNGFNMVESSVIYAYVGLLRWVYCARAYIISQLTAIVERFEVYTVFSMLCLVYCAQQINQFIMYFKCNMYVVN